MNLQSSEDDHLGFRMSWTKGPADSQIALSLGYSIHLIPLSDNKSHLLPLNLS